MAEERHKINVEQIMKEIREDIKQKGYTGDLLSFEDVNEGAGIINADNAVFSFEGLVSELQAANAGYVVKYYRNPGNNGIKSFMKKAIRKMLCFLINPMAEEQTNFNACVVRSLNQIVPYISEQEEKQKEYRLRIQDLETELQKAKQKCEKLEVELQHRVK